MADYGGRVALVTGGASGIGLACVRRLSAGGARVASVDLQAAPDGAAELALRADVADAAAWPGLLDEVEGHLGALDILHLNAGVTANIADLAAVDDATYHRLMRVNVDHVFYGLRAALPRLSARGGGRVVVTASLAGLVGFGVDPVYTMTKHAVVGLVRGAADRAAADGVILTAVCPGIADTPLIGADRDTLVAASFPLLSADDVADAVEAALERGAPGDCWWVQPGRPSEPFRFRNIPGPRTTGAEGVRPPL